MEEVILHVKSMIPSPCLGCISIEFAAMYCSHTPCGSVEAPLEIVIGAKSTIKGLTTTQNYCHNHSNCLQSFKLI
ncbi:hypothetical protein I3843_15G134800 [Carya illinoinensis]|nr:hypothetical protein I3843_15G134800 [Carya illinoinensis]